MDEDLKNVLIYVAGTIFGYSAFLSLILKFTSDIHLILIDTFILAIIIWLFFIQTKINKGGKTKDDKKRT